MQHRAFEPVQRHAPPHVEVVVEYGVASSRISLRLAIDVAVIVQLERVDELAAITMSIIAKRKVFHRHGLDLDQESQGSLVQIYAAVNLHLLHEAAGERRVRVLLGGPLADLYQKVVDSRLAMELCQ